MVFGPVSDSATGASDNLWAAYASFIKQASKTYCMRCGGLVIIRPRKSQVQESGPFVSLERFSTIVENGVDKPLKIVDIPAQTRISSTSGARVSVALYGVIHIDVEKLLMAGANATGSLRPTPSSPVLPGGRL